MQSTQGTRSAAPLAHRWGKVHFQNADFEKEG